MSRTSALQFIRDYYGEPAYRGGRVTVLVFGQGWREATIISGKRLSKKCAALHVKFDGATKTALIDPSFGVHYH